MSIVILKKDISNYVPTENTNIKKRFPEEQCQSKKTTNWTKAKNKDDLQFPEGRNNSFNTHKGGLNVGPVQEMI